MSQGHGSAAESISQSWTSAEEFVRHAVSNNELVMDVDGFYKWWPTDAVVGEALTAENLRAVAEWLDSRNCTLSARFFQKAMENCERLESLASGKE